MDDGLLIQLVQKSPALYDPNDEHYLNKSYKRNAWKKIATQVESDVNSCKTRWRNIRDQYRKNLRKVSTNAAKAHKLPYYKYSEQVSFLNDYFIYAIGEEGTTRTSTPKVAAIGQDEKGDDQICVKIENPLSDEEVNEWETNSDLQSDSSCDNQMDTPLTTITAVAGVTALPLTLSPSTSKSNLEITTNQHPIDAFLAGISPTLKTLDPYLLNLAKSEIFSTVQKYEMRFLKQKQSPRTTSESTPP